MKQKLVGTIITFALLPFFGLSTVNATNESTLIDGEECPPSTSSMSIENRLQQLARAHDEHIKEQRRIHEAEQAELQRQREEERQARLQQIKNRFKVHFTKELLKQDKVQYNSILKVVTKMLEPINKGKHFVRGGVARIDGAMEILNDLLAIHKEEECGSQGKYQRLDNLLIKANTTLSHLDHSDYLPHNFQDSGFEQPISEEIQSYRNRVLCHRQWISSVGGNVSAGAILIPQMGLGSAIGTSSDACGKRKATAGLHGTLGFGVGVYGSAGYYGYDTTHQTTRFYSRGEKDDFGIVSIGCIIGGGLGWSNTPSRKATAGEIGINAGVHILKCFLHGGVNLFPLPGQDMKLFREHVGLVPATAKLPASLEAEIEQCTSKRELTQINMNNSF